MHTGNTSKQTASSVDVESATITFLELLNCNGMDNDKTIEELEKRKRELQLRHDIAKLERSERARDTSSKLASKAASWGWWWVSPLALVGVYFVLGGLTRGKPLAILPGIAFLAPMVLKAINYWNK